MSRFLPILRALALVLLLAPNVHAQTITYPTAALSIQTSLGVVKFTVEVATTDLQQEHGLMFRKHLDRNHGMLFVFAKPQYLEFWMKNTLIPLDMLFIGPDGTIRRIVRNAPPLSLAKIPSGSSDIKEVLELAGGTARYYRIARGDKVHYSLAP